jgi:hypothetical protein
VGKEHKQSKWGQNVDIIKMYSRGRGHRKRKVLQCKAREEGAEKGRYYNVKQGGRGQCNLSIRILTDKLFDFKLFRMETSSLQRMVLCLALMALKQEGIFILQCLL